MIISGAESFFMRGNEHGVLLIHGFTGNPAELLLFGKYLNAEGFTVLGIRLAGHGTNEKDLSRTTKEDWINSVIDGFSILHGCCEKVSVIGHSMGGLLTLKLATISSIKIYKLITLSAPIFINEELGLKFLPPREECLGLMTKSSRRKLKDVPPAVNRVYRKMPFVSIHELVDLLNDVKRNLKRVEFPILIFHGKEDHTANVESAEYIYENVASSKKQIELIDNMGHLLPLSEGRENIFKLTANFLITN